MATPTTRHSYGEQGEIRLIQRAASGDDDAYTALFEMHFDDVYSYAHWLSNDSAIAEDLTQEAFIQMYRKLSEFGPPWNLRSWLYRLVHNRFVDVGRREQASEPMPEHPRWAAGGPGPERAALSGEVRAEVQRALRRLPTLHREILVLREMAEMSYNDISTIMEISLDYVKVLLHRARQSFKEQYGLLLLAEDQLPDCDVLNELLDGFHDGEGVRGEKLIRKHLRECPTCQQRRRELIALSTLLSALPPIAAPPHFQDRLRRRLRRGQRRGQRGGSRPVPGLSRALIVAIPVILAALAGVTLLALNLTNNDERRDGSGQQVDVEEQEEATPEVTPTPTLGFVSTQNSTLLTPTLSAIFSVPDAPDNDEIVTVIEPVWYCTYLGNDLYQWYEVEISYQDGAVIDERIVSGAYTGPWQPNCPAGDTAPGGGDGGTDGGGSGPVCTVSADCKAGCKCVNNTCVCK